MTNKEIESYRNSYKVVNGIGFCRVNNDINGNPRYVVHFLAFTTDEEMKNDNLSQSQLNTLIVALFSTLKPLNVQTNYRRLYHVD